MPRVTRRLPSHPRVDETITPPAGRSRRSSLRRPPRAVRIVLLLSPALAVVLTLFVGGLSLGVAQSLGYLPFVDGWTWNLDAYRRLWDDPAVRASFALTARIGVISTVLSTVLGVGCALAVHRMRRARRLVGAVFASTLPVPHLVGGLTMLLLLSQSGLLSRLTHTLGLTSAPADFPAITADAFGWAIIAEYVWKETPFVGVVTLAALAGGVDELQTAARTLGATGWQRFRHVVLPLISPAVAATSVLVFAFTVGSYEVPLLLGRPFPAPLSVVALQYQQDVDLDARPVAMAIAVVIAVVVSGLVLVYIAAMDRLVRRTP